MGRFLYTLTRAKMPLYRLYTIPYKPKASSHIQNMFFSTAFSLCNEQNPNLFFAKQARGKLKH